MKKEKPSWEKYYMDIAISISKRTNCLLSKVGAIAVVENRIIATGYNGVPEGMTNCEDEGCYICCQRKKEKVKKRREGKDSHRSGKKYNDCICVHAEQNVLVTAARMGIHLQGAEIYSTYAPCFGCSKQLLQAKVKRVVFRDRWKPSDRRLEGPYQVIQDEFPEGVWKYYENGKVELLSRKRKLNLKSGSSNVSA